MHSVGSTFIDKMKWYNSCNAWTFIYDPSNLALKPIFAHKRLNRWFSLKCMFHGNFFWKLWEIYISIWVWMLYSKRSLIKSRKKIKLILSFDLKTPSKMRHIGLHTSCAIRWFQAIWLVAHSLEGGGNGHISPLFLLNG